MTDRNRSIPTVRTWFRAGAAAAVAGVLLAGCSSGDDAASGSSTTAPTTTSPSTTKPAEASMRGKRYCEVLLVQPSAGKVTADVYNSYPLNDCPEAQWSALDAKAIATAAGVPVALLNGPRFWLMDRVKKEGGAADLPKKDFGGIEMYRQASVEVSSMADAAVPYRPQSVDRKAVFTFDAGQTVYELTAADGTKYVMQTWSQQKDPSLVESGLASLASRLQLPAGWSYAARKLDAPLVVDTGSQTAKVLQDDLGNSYSQETSG
jgi:hypothetical protein